ncbi:beta-ketoacyl-[acyl-carrier-protein] synthase family protein [bacterium]|nr:beta-ketoacyl-[acyl-carrier-protein] synthase family protein [bacterium]
MNVAITGLGAISAAGGNLSETLETFGLGKRNAAPVSLFPTSLKHPSFEVQKIPEEWNRGGSRTLQLALCATNEALEDAGIKGDVSSLRVGVCFGTTAASQLNDVDFYRAYRETGTLRMDSVDRFLKGNLAEVVAHTFDLHGPAAVVVNACTSGADAIGMALSWLRNDVCDVAVAGGSDELNLIALSGFASLGILSESLCAPYDRNRKGLNLGEGAGVLVLESEAVYSARGAKPKRYLMGYGSSSDAYHLTAPRPDGTGLESALRTALNEANIKPDDVSFVNAHGTATLDNDKIEGAVFTKVFGKGTKFLSTKGFTGHTLGAAGGLEAVFTTAALDVGWIPASAGFNCQDEEIGISPVSERTPIAGRYAVSTSLAFGGNNSALVIASAE